MPLTRLRFESSESESEINAKAKAKAKAKALAITLLDQHTSDKEETDAVAESPLANQPHQSASRTNTGRSVHRGPPRPVRPPRKVLTLQDEWWLIKAICKQCCFIFGALIVVMGLLAYLGASARRGERGWKPRLHRNALQPALDSHFVHFVSSINKANETYHETTKPDLVKAQILEGLAQDTDLFATYLGNLHRTLLDIYSSAHPALWKPYDCNQLLPALRNVSHQLVTLEAQAGLMLGNLTNLDMSRNGAGLQEVSNALSGAKHSGDLLSVQKATASLKEYVSKPRYSRAKEHFELTNRGVGGCCSVDDPESSAPKYALFDPDGCIENRLHDFDNYVKMLYIEA